MNFKSPFLLSKISSLIFSLLLLTTVGCSSDLKKTDTKLIEAGNIKPKKSLPEKLLKKWWQLDINKDSVPGVSIERAYDEILKNTVGKPVIVAVIDAGLDINHEDLKSVLWKNPKEISGNDKDDDGNGYIDDIHGWNFLGENNIMNNSSTRMVKKLGKKYKNANPSTILEEDKAAYKTYLEAKKVYDATYSDIYPPMQEEIKRLDRLEKAHRAISKILKKETYAKSDLSKINNKSLKPSIALVSEIFSTGYDPVSEIKELKKIIDDYREMFKSIDLKSSDRTTSDNPNDINDAKYGNNQLDGGFLETAAHGTHVAGIVAAISNTEKINNIKIMALRVVPTKGGDENDKDVALAIRYAVDNGAKVINMSFNKSFSINANWVKEAIKYAQQKDVLLVNAAGNDSESADKTLFFPNDEDASGKEYVGNYIVVGSINYKYNESLVSGFSNYGKKRVDIFAPGEKIWSTMPGNKYDFDSGTSMAAPLVAGIAAIVRSQYPNLTANQVKKILMDSGVKVKIKVNLPNATVTGMFGNSEMDKEAEMEDFESSETETATNPVQFSELCKSGKIINLYNALIVAGSY